MQTLIAAILFFSVFIQPAFAINTSVDLDDTSQYIKQLLNLINQYREINGLNPISLDSKLTILAQKHSADMQRRQVLSHYGFEERFKHSGRNNCVENVAWNYGSANELFATWQNSTLHNKNMLVRNIKSAGISRVGYYITFFACN